MKQVEYIAKREELKELQSDKAKLEQLLKKKVGFEITLSTTDGDNHSFTENVATASIAKEVFLEPALERVQERISILLCDLSKSSKKPIPVWTECKLEIEKMGYLGRVLEDCIFCGNETNTWHFETNNPICVDCARTHYVSEIKEDFGEHNRKLMAEGKFNYGTSKRAN